MVSINPSPPPSHDLSHFYMNMNGTMKKNNIPDWYPGSGLEDPNTKTRKPYTITKSRESWSEQEHDKFIEALHLFDRDWKKIEAFVGSKTVIQIRSHAQKYFLKVQKNGTSEHVPPPRPKRKAAHPYPQKAPKTGVSQATGSLQSSAPLLEFKSAESPDLMAVPRNPTIGAPLSPWTNNVVPTGSVSHPLKDDFGSGGVPVRHKYSGSSSASTRRVWTSNETNHQDKQILPDFTQVYRFIGSIFDPDASDHLQRLKRMDSINVETALMLMKNLSVNLVSPEFEDQRKLLSSNSFGAEKDGAESTTSSV